MKQPLRNRLLHPSSASVIWAALAVVTAIAVLDLIGWMLDVPFLKAINPQWTPMKVITALCFLASVSAIALVRESAPARWRIRLAQACGAAVGLVGLATLATYLTELHTGAAAPWSDLPFLDLFLGTATRMAVITAILYSAFGGILMLLAPGGRRAAGIGHAVLLPVTLMAYLVVVGYIFDVPEFYRWLNLGVAINTSLAFCALFVAALCVRPETWLMRVFAGDEAGAVMARRLLPPLLLLPLVIGWLRIHGERAGLFDSALGVALVAVTYSVCFFGLVWLAAAPVNRTDRRRRKAEEALRQLNAELESRVAGQTQELRRSNQTVQDERQRLYEVLETLPVYVILVTPDYHVAFSNRFFEERFGKSDGRHCYEYLFGCTEPCEDCEAHQVMKTRGPRHWEWTGSDGRIYDTYDFPFTDSDGTPLVLEMGIDITERRRAEAALKEINETLEHRVAERTAELARSNKDLEQFAYVASHDLQEPLRMVTGFMGLLQEKYKGRLDATADQYIHFAADGARRMQGLISDLLAYSRAGTGEATPTPVDSGGSLQVALANLKAGLAESGAQVTRGDLPTVRAVGPQLAQLFQNLVGNALKFRGAEPPKVHVDARRDGTHWVFSVRDNGIGIDPQFQDRIFMIFQRLHTRQQYPGSGIGLAICKKIVERHGGRIWVESQPGQGSTFFFTLQAEDIA